MLRVSNARRSVALAAAPVLLLLGFVIGRYSATDANSRHDQAAANARNSRETSEHLRWEAEDRPALASIRVEDLSHIPSSELAEVLEHRDAREIAQLAQKFDSLPPNPATYANLRPFFKTWAQFDEQSAFKAALTFADKRTQEIAIGAIAESASPEGAGRIAQLIRDQPAGTFRDGIKAELLDSAVENWSQKNPAPAAQFILENPELREMSGSKILRNWGWIEGPAAVGWLKEHPSGSDYAAFKEFPEAMLGWLEKDPAGASTYIIDHLDDPNIAQCVNQAASGLVYADKSLALQWPDKLPAGEIREIAIVAIAREYAETDPREAANWVVQLSGRTGIEALDGVIAKWAQKDLDAALGWINSSAGNLRDQALASFSQSVTGSASNKAIEAANLIFDPSLRFLTVEALVRNRSDSSSQQIALIQSSLLSREQKAQLLASVGKPETP